MLFPIIKKILFKFKKKRVLYKMSEITFKINIPIYDEDDIPSIKSIIKYIDSIIKDKENAIALALNNTVSKRRKSRIEILDIIEEQEEKELEESILEKTSVKEDTVQDTVQDVVQVPTKCKFYELNVDGSVNCFCGSNTVFKNLNRHCKTIKHVTWAKLI